MSEKLNEIVDETPLWRYMSFSKLVSLLSQRALYFSRPDGFIDPFEGALGAADKLETIFGPACDGFALAMRNLIAGTPPKPPLPSNRLLTMPEEIYAGIKRLLAGGVDRGELASVVGEGAGLQFKKDISERLRTEYISTFICCWHNAEHESEAMWRLYAKDTAEGVAFRTTVGLLRNSVRDQRELIIRRVEYRDDYVYSLGSNDDRLARFLTKRLAFAHESEVRAIICDSKAGQNNEVGVGVPVNVPELIQEIVVSPYAPAWMPGIVAEVARKFDVCSTVNTSRLSVRPFYYISPEYFFGGRGALAPQAGGFGCDSRRGIDGKTMVRSGAFC